MEWSCCHSASLQSNIRRSIKISSLITDSPANGKALPIKFGSIETAAKVTVNTDKFFLVEIDGVPYKLAVVE